MNKSPFVFLEEKTNLIPFVVTGDPNLQVTLDILHLLDEEGVAAIELGVPFSDPVADGPVIQAASARALSQGVNLSHVLEVAGKAREQGVTVPFILFSYVNPIFQYGWGELFQTAQEIGIQGMIIPDLPFEEARHYQLLAERYGIAIIPLVAPTSRDRIEKIVKQAQGFVYCVSSLGTTGIRSEFQRETEYFLQMVRSLSPLPTAVGFGVSKQEHVKNLSQYADAVVIGSAWVQAIDSVRERLNDVKTKKAALEELREFVRQLKSE